MSIRLSAWKMSAVYTYYISVRLLRLLVLRRWALPEPPSVGRATKYRFSRYSFLLFLKPKRRVRRQPIYHMKKFLSLLCAAIIGFSNLTHAYDFEVDGIYYNILSETDCTVEVTSSGSSQNDKRFGEDIIIPSSVSFNETTYTVTTIGERAFYESCLASVTFPETLIFIENRAFYWCLWLTSVSFPNTCKLTTIGEEAFAHCSALTSVIFPESVTSIEKNAFIHCSTLTSVAFPKTLTIIEKNAFSWCSALTSLTFPSDGALTTIGEGAFFYCESLISLTFPASLITIEKAAFSDCSSLKSVVFPETGLLSEIKSQAFWHCQSLSSVILPKDCNLTTIVDELFIWCPLTSITLPNSLTIIGNNAFAHCSALTSITLPESLTTIGRQAFTWCSALTSLIFPESITTIGEVAFWNCDALTSVYIPETCNLTTIERMAFCECRALTNITLPKSLTTIGEQAFNGCSSLPSVTLPESVTSIGEKAFYDCDALTSLTFPESLVSVEEMAFYDCDALTSIIFPESLRAIGRWAFCSCDVLTSVIFPKNCKINTIDNRAFSGCTFLTSVVFPESLTAIGEESFYGCSRLTLITNKSTAPPTINKNVFDTKVYEQATLKVPDGCVDAYKEADVWKLFSKIEGGALSGIEDVAQDEKPVTVYTLGGVVVYTGLWNERPELPAGMYIVRNADGTSRKVAIR